MMTPFLAFLVLLAVFFWRQTRNPVEFTVRFVAASIFFLIPYLVVAFAFTLVSGTFQLREDGKNGESSRSPRLGSTRAFNPRMKAPMCDQEYPKSSSLSRIH